MERSIRPIGAVLIANRGEIALRIARSCRSRGVRVLGVYTAEDADQLHASSMDACVEVAAQLSQSSPSVRAMPIQDSLSLPPR